MERVASYQKFQRRSMHMNAALHALALHSGRRVPIIMKENLLSALRQADALQDRSTRRRWALRAPLPLIISYILGFGSPGTAFAVQPQLNRTGMHGNAPHSPRPGGREAPSTLQNGKSAIASANLLKPFSLDAPGSAVKIEMLPIRAGSIAVALPEGKGSRTVRDTPLWIARTETTWEMFDAFTSSGPPSPAYDRTEFAADAVARPSKSYIPPDLGWGHHGYPAIHISALNAQMYCRWLAKQTGRKFRLPNEAEWEFACRAGTTGSGPIPRVSLDNVAWHLGNSDRVTHPVGKKQPNAWGLYDMLGNAGEWAVDMAGKFVLCGGDYKDKPELVKPGRRAYWTPAWQEEDPQIPKSRWWLSDAHFAGFRIVCDP